MTVVTAPLFEHQEHIVDACSRSSRLAVLAEPGLGKTRAMLEVIDRKRLKALVLCPKSIVHAAWIEDVKKFGFDFFTIDGTGTPKERSEARREFFSQQGHGVLILNYESFRIDVEHWIRGLSSSRIDALVLDESTKIKTHTAKITKAAWKLSRLIDHCWIMTGCIAPRDLLDIYSQYRVLSPQILGVTFSAFRQAYFFQPSPERNSWLWIPKQGAKENLLRLTKPHSIIVRKKDALPFLPDQTYLKRLVPPTKDEGRLYRDFLLKLIVEYNAGKIVAQNVMIEILRSRQILAGTVKDDQDRWHDLPTPSKTRELFSLLDEINPFENQVMVAGAFRRELENLKKEMDKREIYSTILYGGLTDTRRREVIKGFQEGAYHVLLVHPQAMAHGLTFVNCSNVIWHSLPWSYEEFYQLNQRIHRIGQKSACTYHLLCSSVTRSIDEQIINVLLSRRDLSNDVALSLLGVA